MTTLWHPIDRLTYVGRCVSSADIPIKLNGEDFDIEKVAFDTQKYDDGVIQYLYVNMVLLVPKETNNNKNI